MREPTRFDLETLYLLHEQQFERFGGKPGLQDPGLVALLLNRAENRCGCDGEDVDLAARAAAHLCGFARSQGFADGNERLALASALVLLHVHGMPLHVAPPELYHLAMAVSDEWVCMPEEEAAAWFRARLRPR